MDAISTLNELKAWLADKPASWASALALRIALRVLPIACNPARFRNKQADSRLTLTLHRALAISGVAASIPTTEIDAAYTASAADRAARAAHAARAPADAAAAAAARAAETAADAADAAAAADAAYAAGYVATYAADAAVRAGRAAGRAAYAAFWKAISVDIAILAQNDLEGLRRQPVWPGGVPAELVREISAMQDWMRASDQGFGLWWNWYARISTGADSAFGLPHDAEAEMGRRLIARDDEWWKREPALVNANIQGWIDELTPPEIPAGDIIPDPQTIRAPSFTSLPDGRFTIDTAAGRDAVGTDDASQTRHAAALNAVQKFADAMRGDNNAGYFAPICDDLTKALGTDVSQIEPSMTVLHAETLRQAITIQQAAGPTDNLQPLKELKLLASITAQNAVNLYIGSDPFLDSIDRLLPGPDTNAPLVEPATVAAVALAAERDDIIDSVAVTSFAEAVANAPVPPSHASRQSGLLTGLATNFVRYGVAALLTYPAEIGLLAIAGSVATAVATVGLAPTALGIFPIGYGLVRFIKANEERLREMASSSKITLANFNEMIRLLHKIPTKSPKDE